MSYLGRGLEQVDNISKLDNITFNGGTTYALTKDSAAFTPISSNAILISIDGVIQQGNFSVSGTNIVFNFSPTGSNTCDFILHYGTGVAFTPADNSITKDKTNFVSTSSSAGLEIKGDGTTDGYIQLNCSQGSHGIKLKSPNHASSSSYTLTFPATDPAANKMLQTDGSGNLSFVDAPGGGLVRLGGASATGQNVGDVSFDVFSSTYNFYVCFFRINMIANASQVWLKLRSSGSYTTSSDYKQAMTGINWDGNTRNLYSNTGRAYVQLTSGTGSDDNLTSAHGSIVFSKPNSSSHMTDMSILAHEQDSAAVLSSRHGGAIYQNNASLGGFGFMGQNQNLEQYDIQVFGVKES